MKEIGGYFGLEQLKSNEYYKDLIPLNSGRNALSYILIARNIKKLYIPYYLCNSVSTVCRKKGIEIEYYRIDNDFLPMITKDILNNEYIYIVNYYGQLENKKIVELKQKFRQIILDNVQAFFQPPLTGIDTLYSCRKFFGTPDGAYLSTDCRLLEKLRIDISYNRIKHIVGRYEGIASDYYNDFKNSEASLENEPLKRMSKFTHNILGAIDYEEVCHIREVNYNYLESELGVQNKLRLVSPQGAFAYPFYAEDGINIRKALAEKKIYIPMFWTNVLEAVPKDSTEYMFVTNILPIPCDQRYGIEDMKWVIENLRILSSQ